MDNAFPLTPTAYSWIVNLTLKSHPKNATTTTTKCSAHFNTQKKILINNLLEIFKCGTELKKQKQKHTYTHIYLISG